MNTEVIPEDVRKFILQNIDSIAQLEGLLLFRADPALQGRPSAIADRLYVTQEESTDLLEQLTARGFLSRYDDNNAEPVYTYSPRTTENANLIDSLADHYVRFLVPITNLVHSKPKSRIQKFADAFWIRKD